MIRRDDYFILTKIDNMIEFERTEQEYAGHKLNIVLKVDYCYSVVDFNEKVILPKSVVVLLEDKFDVMIIQALKPRDMESKILECVSSHYIELNEEGKDYYNMLCMMLNNNETDDNWCDINELIGKYKAYNEVISY